MKPNPDDARRAVHNHAATNPTTKAPEVDPQRLKAHYALMFPGGRDDLEDSDGLATDRALADATEAYFTSIETDPLGPQTRADLLTQLQRQVAEGIVAVALAEGRDPAQALQVDLAQELLADRAADAAQEARRGEQKMSQDAQDAAKHLATRAIDDGTCTTAEDSGADLPAGEAVSDEALPETPTRVAGEVAPEVLLAELQQWIAEGTAALDASQGSDGAAGPRLSMDQELVAERRAEASAEAEVEGETEAAREDDTAPPALSAGQTAAIRARLLQELREVDYVRAVQRWAATGTSRREIARALHQNERVISTALAREDVGVPLPGFAGVGPLEIAKRYAAGELTREQLVAQLVAFPYVKVERDPYDDVSPEPPGTWAEVVDAHELGYIDLDLYDEVQTRRRAERTGETAYLSLSGEPIEPSPQARERATAPPALAVEEGSVPGD